MLRNGALGLDAALQPRAASHLYAPHSPWLVSVGTGVGWVVAAGIARVMNELCHLIRAGDVAEDVTPSGQVYPEWASVRFAVHAFQSHKKKPVARSFWLGLVTLG